MSGFSSVLIANRGEIALRVIRTVKALGLRAVAVYSEADAGAVHVSAADEAVCIGPASAELSYLNIDAVLAAAKLSGAEAVHPGYGFLSENAAFARACADAGLVFIGPPAEAIELMGDKGAAKRALRAAGAPCLPGYEGADQSDETLINAARATGFPLMIKAAAGGGGRGMRRVARAEGFADALASARAEALRSFGDEAVILERLLEGARHVEVQVLADAHGSCVHLGERDCSLQRRHQKVIEEAPSPAVSPQLRAQMGAAAVTAARAAGYVGAGTVEFLLDADGAFYFLEMNTRLQVEHPVTEMITGRDLVAAQILIAQGAGLGFGQEDVTLNGWAVEARLYAEDPARGFAPSAGRVEAWRPPSGAGVRVDAGVGEGVEISPHYDPMVAKVIAHGPDRDTALRRLRKALGETLLAGPRTNRDFLIACLETKAFMAGAATTAFLDETFPDGFAPQAPSAPEIAVAAVIGHELDIGAGFSETLRNWSSASAIASPRRYALGEAEVEVGVLAQGPRVYAVRGPDGAATLVAVEAFEDGRAVLRVDGARARVAFHRCHQTGALTIADADRCAVWRDLVRAPQSAEDVAGGGGGAGVISAPMHGQVREVLVEAGAVVEKGARLAVLEAMKMHHDIRADMSGVVAEVSVAAGGQVASDEVMFVIAAAQTESAQ